MAVINVDGTGDPQHPCRKPAKSECFCCLCNITLTLCVCLFLIFDSRRSLSRFAWDILLISNTFVRSDLTSVWGWCLIGCFWWRLIVCGIFFGFYSIIEYTTAFVLRLGVGDFWNASCSMSYNNVIQFWCIRMWYKNET